MRKKGNLGTCLNLMLPYCTSSVIKMNSNHQNASAWLGIRPKLHTDVLKIATKKYTSFKRPP